jgi:ribosome maturation factor RimP
MELMTSNPEKNSENEIKQASPAPSAWVGAESWQPSHPELWKKIANHLEALGYELIHLEVHIGRQNILRLFIEHLEWNRGGIGIEDCARVSRALDEPLDAMGEIEALFHGAYELEVSSPGVDRPLRTLRDFERFKGREVRLYIDRPLTLEEAGNAEFCKKHPKQKTFLGISQGVNAEGKIELDVMKDEGTSAKTKGRPASPSKGGKKGKDNVLPRICLPPERITKANLEPDYDTSGTPVEEIEGGTEQ